MNQINPLLTLPLASDAAVSLISRLLSEDGLRVMRSFDLQSACAAFSDNICPSHGKSPCNCQLVVFLVYDESPIPLTVVIHGHNGKTQLGISDEIGHVPVKALQVRVQELLSFENVGTHLKVFIPNTRLESARTDNTQKDSRTIKKEVGANAK